MTEIVANIRRPTSLPIKEERHLTTLRSFLDGDQVAGDCLLKAGLWVVTEVLRRNETPSFRRNFFAERLLKARSLAYKHISLLRGWPGCPPLERHELVDQDQALATLDLLEIHSPQDDDMSAIR